MCGVVSGFVIVVWNLCLCRCVCGFFLCGCVCGLLVIHVFVVWSVCVWVCVFGVGSVCVRCGDSACGLFGICVYVCVVWSLYVCGVESVFVWCGV